MIMGWKEEIDIAVRKQAAKFAGVGRIGERYDGDSQLGMFSETISNSLDYGGNSASGEIIFIFLAQAESIRGADILSKIFNGFTIKRTVDILEGLDDGVFWQVFNFQSAEPAKFIGLSDDGKKRIYRMRLNAFYNYQT